MAIEHKDIPDAGLHEPKGAVSAASGEVYVSDGVGSGTWKPPQLAGQSSATSGTSPVSDGAGSVTWEQANPSVNYGVVVAANLTQVIALTGADLHTSSSYTSLSQYFTVRGTGGDITADINKKFVVGSTGVYKITGWISVSSSAAAAELGWDVGINGVYATPGSPIVVSKADPNDPQTLPGFGIQPLTAGDVIDIAIASGSNTNVTLREGVFDIVKLS